ncbi:hypothetical protein RF11_08999 [Thelohanellus kitauei]|uniref:Uncharacterized protein n=1 Tax=Thelohanellus kitauei TaxID=669202 RepID=A0A0C2J142_THEKT|nr:hypothetical protein RF11_08999 [Thelohanellus kitauei]
MTHILAPDRYFAMLVGCMLAHKTQLVSRGYICLLLACQRLSCALILGWQQIHWFVTAQRTVWGRSVCSQSSDSGLRPRMMTQDETEIASTARVFSLALLTMVIMVHSGGGF